MPSLLHILSKPPHLARKRLKKLKVWPTVARAYENYVNERLVDSLFDSHADRVLNTSQIALVQCDNKFNSSFHKSNVKLNF